MTPKSGQSSFHLPTWDTAPFSPFKLCRHQLLHLVVQCWCAAMLPAPAPRLLLLLAAASSSSDLLALLASWYYEQNPSGPFQSMNTSNTTEVEQRLILNSLKNPDVQISPPEARYDDSVHIQYTTASVRKARTWLRTRFPSTGRGH